MELPGWEIVTKGSASYTGSGRNSCCILRAQAQDIRVFVGKLTNLTQSPSFPKRMLIGPQCHNKKAEFSTGAPMSLYSVAKIHGVCGGCDPPNLENSPFRRAIKDFTGHQEKLYCRTETPPLKFVKGRLGILK